MEKKVSRNDETQENIHVIPPIVPLDLLFCYLGISLNFYGISEYSLTPHQNIHLCLPFEVVEWIQDDIMRLIHLFSNWALA